MLWFIITALRAAIAKSHDWTSNLNGAIAVVATVAITGILVHSLVDFNLQIPANGALFYCFCVVAAMEPRFASHHRGHRRRHAEVANSPEQTVSV
jgi:hypothetical protein